MAKGYDWQVERLRDRVRERIISVARQLKELTPADLKPSADAGPADVGEPYADGDVVTTGLGASSTGFSSSATSSAALRVQGRYRASSLPGLSALTVAEAVCVGTARVGAM